MAEIKTPPPWQPVICKHCHWRGPYARASILQDEVARCPKCLEAVEMHTAPDKDEQI